MLNRLAFYEGFSANVSSHNYTSSIAITNRGISYAIFHLNSFAPANVPCRGMGTCVLHEFVHDVCIHHVLRCCPRMGLVFSPGLIGLNILKLVVVMYIRSWAVMVTNVPPKRIFKASHQFYLLLLLAMLFLCLLAVMYATFQ